MKNKLSRTLSLFLVVLMVLSVAPTVSLNGLFTLQASAETYSGTCGDDLTWSLDTATGVLTISGVGDMDDYDSSEVPWHKYSDSIKSITISSGVTSICDRAFLNCESLESITIPDGVTSIGDYAFDSCISLNSVTIPDSVTSIGEYAFHDCSNLTSITIPGSVTSIGWYTFFGCSSLTSIIIPDSVTSIGWYAFCYCESLSSVTIPDSVKSIGREVFYDTALYNNESNWTDGVLYIGKHLINAQTSISGDYTIKSGTLTIADFAFWYCYDLTKVTIPDSVTSIGGYAFSSCNSLTSITIPDSVTSIGVEAFFDCNSLESITIPDGVTSIGSSAFESCSSLNSVTIPDSVTSIGEHAFGYNYNLKHEKNDDFKIYCYEDTAGKQYAIDNGFAYELLSAMQSGDINGDGEIDSSDALAALKCDAGMTDLSEDQLNVADVNTDGAVDSADATMILKYDAGIIDEI